MKVSTRNLIALTGTAAKLLGIKEYPGYATPFTKRHAKGAIPNGTLVVKAKTDAEGDIHPAGTRGRVLGSFRIVPHPICYFVEWEPSPGIATSCIADKITRAP